MGNAHKTSGNSIITKKSSPVILNVSEQFVNNLNEYIKTNPPTFSYRLENFYYLIHYIFLLKNRHKNVEFVAVNNKHLKSIIGSKFERYAPYLKNGNLILCDNKFTKGVKPYMYKIDEKYCFGN